MCVLLFYIWIYKCKAQIQTDQMRVFSSFSTVFQRDQTKVSLLHFLEQTADRNALVLDLIDLYLQHSNIKIPLC